MPDELLELLDHIYKKSGYDFRNYVSNSVERRLERFADREKLDGLKGLAEALYTDESLSERLIQAIAIPTTSMFRDPEIFAKLRAEVLPNFADLGSVKIWSAGCSTGEEAYSVAILLWEERLYARSRIYATDFNNQSLHTAKKGVYTIQAMQRYTHNYQLAGGQYDFSDYYSAAYGHAAIREMLKSRITFSHHNLNTDATFNEFDIIFCRNVLIYFDNELQTKVLDLLYDSLATGGYLVLGSKETLALHPIVGKFKKSPDGQRIYEKK